MENTQLNTIQEQLLLARKEGLRSLEKGNIRPMGKLFGMDAFVWCKPNSEDLVATIATFPFPVSLFVNGNRAKEITEEISALKNIAWLSQYDSAQVTISSEILRTIPLFTAAETMEDALLFLHENTVEKKIALFVLEGNNWMDNTDLVEQFIVKSQKK